VLKEQRAPAVPVAQARTIGLVFDSSNAFGMFFELFSNISKARCRIVVNGRHYSFAKLLCKLFGRDAWNFRVFANSASCSGFPSWA
ncbi:MAG: hypothetical protein ACOCWJ_02910, partial [Verrucomicrobiota bacterium]